ARFAALRLQALADGMTDAQILIVYEGRFRPPEHHVKKWTDYQADKIMRGLTALEADPPSLDPIPNVGQIALACFLGHSDLRFAGDWRAAHPKLVVWLDRFAAKVPAFAETKVAAEPLAFTPRSVDTVRAMPSLRDMVAGPWRAVSMLGITQIIAWGTIFYSPVLTAPLIVAETGWSLSFVMGGFSLGLLIAGLVSPFVGRSIDRYGGHIVMTVGALVSALGLLGLAHAGDPVTYLAVWIVLGAGLGASLYDPAFATLGRIFGAAARRPITVLTLAGGFASTAGWPATHLLIEAVGWRGTYIIYAVLIAGVCAPLYAL